MGDPGSNGSSGFDGPQGEAGETVSCGVIFTLLKWARMLH